MKNLSKEASERKKKKEKNIQQVYKSKLKKKKILLSTVQIPPDKGLVSVGNRVFYFTSRPS